jgi:hypothetical protein
MTDPITCPECQGAKGERIGSLFLACRFCGGLGWVGGEHEPAERDQAPPPPPPPAWEHKVWSDPSVAAALPCRYCLGARTVMHDPGNGQMVTVPCPECTRRG